ncbi:formyl transferase, partial [Terfezia claveryi]
CRRLQHQHPPLRILFCGSDHFSATSLKALYKEHKRDPHLIESIDVVTRVDKRVGRGLRTIKEVPAKIAAEELKLPLHEIDTFTGWHPPTPLGGPLNLIVAVSFGRRVPARILNYTLYGGINVHPSLLPTFRGAAPIYHALLNNASFTGVTIQTLHPVLFDHGTILSQSPEIPIPKGIDYQTLHDSLAILGAQMLVHTCRNRLFQEPCQVIESKYPPSEAPKINPEHHARISWERQTAEDLERYCGTLGTLWCRLGPVDNPDRRKRVILSHLTSWADDKLNLDEPAQPGQWRYHETGSKTGLLLIKCRAGWLEVSGIKIEGKTRTQGGEWARSMAANKRGPFVFT